VRAAQHPPAIDQRTADAGVHEQDQRVLAAERRTAGKLTDRQVVGVVTGEERQLRGAERQQRRQLDVLPADAGGLQQPRPADDARRAGRDRAQAPAVLGA
jgi:hypothetical protein